MKQLKYLELNVKLEGGVPAFTYQHKPNIGAPLSSESGHATSVGRGPLSVEKRIVTLTTKRYDAERAVEEFKARFLRFGIQYPTVRQKATCSPHKLSNPMWCVFDHHPGVAGCLKDAVASFNAEYRDLVVQIGHDTLH